MQQHFGGNGTFCLWNTFFCFCFEWNANISCPGFCFVYGTFCSGYERGSVDKVLDSSRYFVMRVVDPSRPNTHAFIGIGFQDRDEAFEFENALRTHDKYAQRQAEIERQNAEWAANHQDLSLKSGQTIQVNFKADSNRSQQRREPRTTGGLTFNFADPSVAVGAGGNNGFFAPPPSAPTSNFSAPAPAASSAQPDWFSSLPAATSGSNATPGFDFFSLPLVPSTSASSASSTPVKSSSSDDWSDFSTGASKNATNDSWANF